jgi:hypothetical protein
VSNTTREVPRYSDPMMMESFLDVVSAGGSGRGFCVELMLEELG